MPAATSTKWPAFHNGGPLLGVAAPIGPPPMKLRWQFRAEDDPPAGKAAAAQVGITPGFESSAAIVDGVVFAADRAGAVRAIDLKTGKRKWTYRVDAGFAASPGVLKGAVYIGDEEGIFHAVNAQTGQKLWTFDAGSSIHSSANFQGDKIVFGDDGADIYCLGPDGKKIWDSKAGDRVNSAPAIGGAEPGQSASVFVSGCDAELRAIDVDTGKDRFTKELGALCPGSPALLEDRIVVGTDGGKILCLSRDGSKQLWEFAGVQNQAMVYASPAVSDGIVAVGTRDRNVYGLDLATGQKKWSFATHGDVDSSPVISAGRVYVGGKDKHFYVLDLKTGDKLWEFVASRGITATAAIADGAVVIGDTAGVLYCFEPKSN
ncbi:MAG TPA: PQQ-binding-like beta-propeller repeat protein [Tepidisphaeraceae bacterium]|jgi:outer membrane protein assembly factor BamB|nr:PQQ-binding-like beta-propeller repeat protein [Tepidisphaeraceae bacterium]